MMTKASATAFSAWLLREHPGVFATILKRTAPRAFSGLGDDSTDADVLAPVDVTATYIDPLTTFAMPDLQPGTLDLSAANATTPSVLSSVGSNIGSAVSGVASFLLKGTAALAPVAVAAIQAKTSQSNTQAQLAVLGLQANRAAAGISPANITYTANGTPVYVPTSPAAGGLTTIPAGLGAPVTLPNGQVGYTLTSQAATNLQPTFLQKYGVFILGGGALLAAVMLFS